MRAKNLAISPDKGNQFANEIFSAIESSEIFARASTIALYHSLSDELPTLEVIKRWGSAKRIVLPRVGRDCAMEFYECTLGSVELGAYGILEPQGETPFSAADIDLVIVPGVAFTLSGGRLGRGKGYYDRYLSRVDFRGYKVGVCYPHQIVDFLPVEEHDVLMDWVVAISTSLLI